MMRVFQVTETEWYAAETPKAAREEYVKIVGEEEAREPLEEFGEPEEVSYADLDRMTITSVDDAGHPTQTFRQALDEIIASGAKVGFVATTEY